MPALDPRSMCIIAMWFSQALVPEKLSLTIYYSSGDRYFKMIVKLEYLNPREQSQSTLDWSALEKTPFLFSLNNGTYFSILSYVGVTPSLLLLSASESCVRLSENLLVPPS